MQITINLPPDLEEDLLRQAKTSNVPLQTIILQALRQIIEIFLFRQTRQVNLLKIIESV
jgi:predicted transcriptional regulator